MQKLKAVALILFSTVGASLAAELDIDFMLERQREALKKYGTEMKIMSLNALKRGEEYKGWAKQLKQRAEQRIPVKGITQGQDVRIFISLSLPRQSLKQLARQSKSLGADLVLCGFKEGDIKKTVQALKALILETGQGFMIDPTLFEEYDIQHIPTFVVSDGQDFDKVSGNITLDEALRILKSEGTVINQQRKLRESKR